ncbi:receptor protein kinase-like protein At4g34220 isoform X2 [Rhodamnia argentea]|uniref:Receptor protein kinase-like protein At4g34220 isoform X2 n=1 Tax=Rhodamnia argentea TaxID=178133 RepID=A0A8B8QA49_9MYRT|nr:receptor protein kinase-like protein At4g34220 isoform X2 [Rhodamnia argentea]
MTPSPRDLHPCLRTLAFSLLLLSSSALNSDGILLLSFKYSILSDPFSVLKSWNYNDVTPCTWNGVTCTQIGDPGTPTMFRVTGLVLPNSKLLGSIPKELGMIEHLTNLDLSSNYFNGSLPSTIINSSTLQVLSLSNNVISGGVPSGFNSVEVLDLSSNLLNGSLPSDFGGNGLRYLNISYNKLSGPIAPGFASKIPRNATIDLSFNNLSGSIPESLAWADQKTEFLAGNSDLCGKPLKILCSIPSTLSTPPNATTTTSPAIAVIPKTVNGGPSANSSGTSVVAKDQTPGGLKPGTIAGIAVGDLAGIGVLALVILYVYQLKKRKSDNKVTTTNEPKSQRKPEPAAEQDPEAESRKPANCYCLTIKGHEASTSESCSSEDDEHKDLPTTTTNNDPNQKTKGTLVTVDGETRLELDTLLRASAYILGASGGSIVYKAVLEDGTAYAVRRIGEGGGAVERMKDFEQHARAIARVKHPNLVRLRGFYWGDGEKLVIYDYVSNGSLAGACSGYRKAGSSPFHLSLEHRLKIARGVARGLAYIHDKKLVHGNIKPAKILLNSDMEPLISDFGLEKLVGGGASHCMATAGSSSSNRFGSQRFAHHQDLSITNTHHSNNNSPFVVPASSNLGTPSPYQAPESLKSFRPSTKWDVYSFGVVLLELLTGRAFPDRDLAQWTAGPVVGSEDQGWVLRMADVAIRADVASREEVALGCFKLAFGCASLAPQKRPSMKEALQVLDKMMTP